MRRRLVRHRHRRKGCGCRRAGARVQAQRPADRGLKDLGPVLVHRRATGLPERKQSPAGILGRLLGNPRHLQLLIENVLRSPDQPGNQRVGPVGKLPGQRVGERLDDAFHRDIGRGLDGNIVRRVPDDLDGVVGIIGGPRHRVGVRGSTDLDRGAERGVIRNRVRGGLVGLIRIDGILHGRGRALEADIPIVHVLLRRVEGRPAQARAGARQRRTECVEPAGIDRALGELLVGGVLGRDLVQVLLRLSQLLGHSRIIRVGHLVPAALVPHRPGLVLGAVGHLYVCQAGADHQSRKGRRQGGVGYPDPGPHRSLEDSLRGLPRGGCKGARMGCRGDRRRQIDRERERLSQGREQPAGDGRVGFHALPLGASDQVKRESGPRPVGQLQRVASEPLSKIRRYLGLAGEPIAQALDQVEVEPARPDFPALRLDAQVLQGREKPPEVPLLDQCPGLAGEMEAGEAAVAVHHPLRIRGISLEHGLGQALDARELRLRPHPVSRRGQLRGQQALRAQCAELRLRPLEVAGARRRQRDANVPPHLILADPEHRGPVPGLQSRVFLHRIQGPVRILEIAFSRQHARRHDSVVHLRDPDPVHLGLEGRHQARIRPGQIYLPVRFRKLVALGERNGPRQPPQRVPRHPRGDRPKQIRELGGIGIDQQLADRRRIAGQVGVRLLRVQPVNFAPDHFEPSGLRVVVVKGVPGVRRTKARCALEGSQRRGPVAGQFGHLPGRVAFRRLVAIRNIAQPDAQDGDGHAAGHPHR